VSGPSLPASDVIVAGAGFAGLAAATALVAAGVRVRLLEARAHPGGRARSWTDPETGAVVDNGQHLFMGCYRDTLELLDRIGCRDRLALQPRLDLPLVDRGGRLGRLRFPPLPFSLARFAGLLSFPGLTPAQRWGLLRVGREVRRLSRPGHPPDLLDDRTVSAWLEALRQGEEARRRLWHPVAIASLNEDPARASAAMLLPVLREAFYGGMEGARLGVARVGLSEMYAEPALHYLRGRGAEVRLRTPVRRILLQGERCAGVLLGDGTRLEAAAVIAAVPPSDLLEMLAPETAADPFFARLARLATVPIVSVYLWLGAPVIDLPFAGLIGGHWEWIFNRQAFTPGGGSGGGLHGVTLVRSAARALVDRPRDALVRAALEDLHDFFPTSRRASLRQALVIKEKRATFSPLPGTLALRPSHATPCRGLFLAGDWTATGLPATIEGAARSGHACARLVLRETT
jgi:hydroxysqualene dehydroxylase